MLLAILQARMSSSRLPGKVLLPILGTPMIVHELRRIERSRSIDQIVVATSMDSSDDRLAEVVTEAGFLVRRGSLTDVLGRFLGVIDEFEPETVVRLTGDNALVDHEVIDRVVEAHQGAQVDYSSNVIVRTFPRGLDTEVFEAAALRSLAASDPSDAEREHVTLGLYSRTGRFTTSNVRQEHDRSELRWTVDYPEDLEFARGVYERLYPGNPDFGQEDVVALVEQDPRLRRLEADVPGH